MIKLLKFTRFNWIKKLVLVKDPIKIRSWKLTKKLNYILIKFQLNLQKKVEDLSGKVNYI